MDGAMYGSFFATATYENITDFELFSFSEEPIWILGVKYSLLREREKVELDMQSRLLFTYRRGFKTIGASGLTSDLGWGCMLRCGQMMMSQALVNRHLTRHWRWKRGKYDPKYFEILRMFQDRQDCCYSIHQIATAGAAEGKSVGEWFGPNTVMQVFRKLASNDQWSGMVVHVAMDSTIIIDDIRSECLVALSVNEPFIEGSDVPSVILSAFQSSLSYKQSSSLSSDVSHCSSSPVKTTDSAGASSVQHSSFRDCTADQHAMRSLDRPDSKTDAKTRKHWQPLLLVIPLRLGLSEINPIYYCSIKTCLTFKQSVGMIGGRPNHAHWFIGYSGDKLYFLDPHTQQPIVDLSATVDDTSYHCHNPSSMDISQLDPSVAVGFYCSNEGEFDDLCQNVRRHFMMRDVDAPLFEVHRHKVPAHVTSQPTHLGGSWTQLFDIEDEYEIL